MDVEKTLVPSSICENPVRKLPAAGLNPTSPVMSETGAIDTAASASTAKLPAFPRITMAGPELDCEVVDEAAVDADMVDGGAVGVGAEVAVDVVLLALVVVNSTAVVVAVLALVETARGVVDFVFVAVPVAVADVFVVVVVVAVVGVVVVGVVVVVSGGGAAVSIDVVAAGVTAKFVLSVG